MLKTPEYTMVPNAYLRDQDRFTSDQLRVLLALTWLTFGVHKDTRTKTAVNIAAMAGKDQNWALRVLNELEADGPDGRPAQVRRTRNGTTVVWELLLEWPGEVLDLRPPPAPKHKKPKDPTPPGLWPMPLAIATVSGTSVETNRSRILGQAKRMLTRWTADQVIAVFGKGGLWWSIDWRGQKGQLPTLGQVESEIERIFKQKELLDSSPDSTDGASVLVSSDGGIYL